MDQLSKEEAFKKDLKHPKIKLCNYCYLLQYLFKHLKIKFLKTSKGHIFASYLCHL